MEENNLTQKQIAEKLNVSPSYVSQISNGNFIQKSSDFLSKFLSFVTIH
ncbi:helix-turn-helix domain-containing protein [Dyadobacter sp. 50-39]